MAGTSETGSLTKSEGKQVVIHSQETNLLSLKATEFDKCIHVKVYRKWTVLNKASMPVMYCCILLDQHVFSYYSNPLLHCTLTDLFLSYREERYRQI